MQLFYLRELFERELELEFESELLRLLPDEGLEDSRVVFSDELLLLPRLLLEDELLEEDELLPLLDEEDGRVLSPFELPREEELLGLFDEPEVEEPEEEGRLDELPLGRLDVEVPLPGLVVVLLGRLEDEPVDGRLDEPESKLGLEVTPKSERRLL